KPFVRRRQKDRPAALRDPHTLVRIRLKLRRAIASRRPIGGRFLADVLDHLEGDTRVEGVVAKWNLLAERDGESLLSGAEFLPDLRAARRVTRIDPPRIPAALREQHDVGADAATDVEHPLPEEAESRQERNQPD